MIETAVILNYKSAKDIQLSCKKLNIFIGPPNGGKSNILEGLGLFSLFNNECKITELARFQTLHNLFYDNNINNPVHIRTNTHRLKIKYKDNFEVDIETQVGTVVRSYDLYYDQGGKLLNSHPHYTSPVNLYKFRAADVYPNKDNAYLRPPFGDNLVQMLIRYPQLRHEAADVFKDFGYKLAINPMDASIKIQKEVDSIIISQPYTLASYMLQRFIFHLAVITSNTDGIIIFEEPESYASTFFSRTIARKIAEDQSNQFFISTHNPNFLNSILKLMPADTVKIYYTYYEDYQTRIKPLQEEDYDLIQKQDTDLMDKLNDKFTS